MGVSVSYSAVRCVTDLEVLSGGKVVRSGIGRPTIQNARCDN